MARWASIAVARAAAVAFSCTALGSAVIWLRGVTGPGRTTDRFASWPFVDMWIRWDAGWYQGIATDGYYFEAAQQSSAAFFPVYPLLMRGLVFLGADPFAAGIVITFVCGLAAAGVFALWARTVAGEQHASMATWALLLWPFAFYLYGAVYSDALFLLLIASAFLFLERGQVWPATLLGAIATATRPVAIAVVLGMLARQIERRRAAGEPIRVVDFAPLLSAAGLAAYMAFLAMRFGDPLAFVRTQAGWSQLTGVDAVFKIGFFRSIDSADDLVLPAVHAVLALSALALCVPMRKRLGWAYAGYCAVVLGMPLISSRDFIGLGRYALAAFPCFAVFAQLTAGRRGWQLGWLAVSAALLGLMTARFAFGRYVS